MAKSYWFERISNGLVETRIFVAVVVVVFVFTTSSATAATDDDVGFCAVRFSPIKVTICK